MGEVILALIRIWWCYTTLGPSVFWPTLTGLTLHVPGIGRFAAARCSRKLSLSGDRAWWKDKFELLLRGEFAFHSNLCVLKLQGISSDDIPHVRQLLAGRLPTGFRRIEIPTITNPLAEWRRRGPAGEPAVVASLYQFVEPALTRQPDRCAAAATDLPKSACVWVTFPLGNLNAGNRAIAGAALANALAGRSEPLHFLWIKGYSDIDPRFAAVLVAAARSLSITDSRFADGGADALAAAAASAIARGTLAAIVFDSVLGTTQLLAALASRLDAARPLQILSANRILEWEEVEEEEEDEEEEEEEEQGEEGEGGPGDAEAVAAEDDAPQAGPAQAGPAQAIIAQAAPTPAQEFYSACAAVSSGVAELSLNVARGGDLAVRSTALRALGLHYDSKQLRVGEKLQLSFEHAPVLAIVRMTGVRAGDVASCLCSLASDPHLPALQKVELAIEVGPRSTELESDPLVQACQLALEAAVGAAAAAQWSLRVANSNSVSTGMRVITYLVPRFRTLTAEKR